MQAEILKKVLATNPELPGSYPPAPAVLANFERSVDRALGEIEGTGALENVDRDAMMRLITFELAGIGPLELYLDDPSIDRVYVNAPDRLFLRRDGQIEQAPHVFGGPDTLELAVTRLVSVGRKIDDCLTTVRLRNGAQIDVVLPPAALNGAAIAVRKPSTSFKTLEEQRESGVLSEGAATFLRQALEAGQSILVAGPPGSGKSSTLNALAATLPDDARIVTVEERASLQVSQPGVVRLESCGLAEPVNLVSHALRLSPSCLIVDDVGPHNCYDWLSSTAYNAVASVVSIGAFGARDALARLESMGLVRGDTHSIRGIRQLTVQAVDFIVVLSVDTNQGSLITQIVEVQGLELDTVRLQDIYYYQAGGDEAIALHPTGQIPAFYEEMRRGGAEPDLSIFRA